MADPNGPFTATVTVDVDATNRTKGIIVYRHATNEVILTVAAGQTGSVSFVASETGKPELEFQGGV